MRELIKGKHLGKVEVYDKKTGKKIREESGSMMMLPAKEGTCQECAVDHDPTYPHNAQSMHYQYKFYNEHGRWPGWKEAMDHCSEQMKVHWIKELKKHGVEVK